MTAVIYARYSSDNQREESIEGQIRECTAYAEKNGITIVKHYIDRAISAKTDNRPEFQQMIKDSDKKLFNIVLVWKLDRFARNRYDSARYKTQLKKNGVKLMSATEIISEGPEGIILESVLEGYAEYYSADLSEKVIRGMTENALKGKFTGGAIPFGYIINADHRFEIDPLTAPFVAETFQRYNDGQTMREIRDWLNEKGVKNQRGGLMTFNTIQHMRIRTPKLIAMLITAFAIGSASIVFQSIINNTIVTPCLLGMDQLYSLIHTAVFFVAGSGSFLAVNANAAFAVDLAIMGAVATMIYSYLFQKTNHNVLYVLLIGTVLTSFFSSIQTTLTRVMDPNEYDTLLTDLVASFSNVNSAILVLSVAVLALVAFALRKELALLDVLTLGKDQAINLGVDYDRCIRRLLLGVTLYIATATAMVGPLAFLGLIIANLSRQFLRTYRHSQLITGSVLFGMVVLIGGQLLVERVFVYSVPVSVFITVGGGVYFLYLLLTQRKA